VKFLLALALLAGGGVYLWDRYDSDSLLNWAAKNVNSQHSEEVEYGVGICNYYADNREKAVKAFSQLIDLHGAGKYAADALYYRASLYQAMGDRGRALADYSRLSESFPDAAKAALARTSLTMLR